MGEIEWQEIKQGEEVDKRNTKVRSWRGKSNAVVFKHDF